MSQTVNSEALCLADNRDMSHSERVERVPLSSKAQAGDFCKGECCLRELYAFLQQHIQAGHCAATDVALSRGQETEVKSEQGAIPNTHPNDPTPSQRACTTVEPGGGLSEELTLSEIMRSSKLMGSQTWPPRPYRVCTRYKIPTMTTVNWHVCISRRDCPESHVAGAVHSPTRPRRGSRRGRLCPGGSAACTAGGR